MAVSKAEFGKKAFELLYTNIQQGTTGYYLNQLELIQRASTAPPGR
jgi:DNA-binding LacI/PurR family transcriptional regulator